MGAFFMCTIKYMKTKRVWEAVFAVACFCAIAAAYIAFCIGVAHAMLLLNNILNNFKASFV